MAINLNDYVTFTGTPINIAWDYQACGSDPGTQQPNQPTITNTALGTIEPSGAVAGTYTYHANYDDSGATGCVSNCVEITITISESITVEWIETDDGYLDVVAGSCTGEFYHLCDFGSPGLGGDIGDLTLTSEILDGPDGVSLPSPTTGTINIDVQVLGGSIAGYPITTGMTASPSGLVDGTFAINDTGVSFTLSGADITAIRAAAGANDIAEAVITITLEQDTDATPACNTTHVINLLVPPVISEDVAVFDCSIDPDPTQFDLYDFILNAGTGNTAPGSLEGGACLDTVNEQDGWHYWVLDNMDAELYALIQGALPACSGANDFTNCIVDNGTAATGFTIFEPLTAGNQMLLNLPLMATEGSHTFDLTHYVEFFHNGQPVSIGDASVYQCVSTGVTFDIDSTDCCTVSETTATPITLCN